jgi:hypothetical protein
MELCPKGSDDVQFELTRDLLNPTKAVEYIAGNLHHKSDLLTSAYGDSYTSLDVETQNRLVLIGYHEGWENIQKKISRSGFYGLIEHEVYDNQTLDEYQRWNNK